MVGGTLESCTVGKHLHSDSLKFFHRGFLFLLFPRFSDNASFFSLREKEIQDELVASSHYRRPHSVSSCPTQG